MTNTYTTKHFDSTSLKILVRAERLALLLGDTHVDVHHVVRSALEFGHFELSLRAVGIDVLALKDEVRQLVGEAPRAFLSPLLRSALDRAVATREGNDVTLGEVIAAIAEEPGPISELLQRYQVDAATLRRSPSAVSFEDRLTDNGSECLERARRIAKERGHTKVGTTHLLLGTLKYIAELAEDKELPVFAPDLIESLERRLDHQVTPVLPGFDAESCRILAEIPHEAIGPLALLSALKESTAVES